jgi:poly-D-alanine transfer protein DltD
LSERASIELTHLRAAAWAGLIVSVFAAGVLLMTRGAIAARDAGFQPVVIAQRSRGLALTLKQLHEPEAVALFGSSELAGFPKNRADRFFSMAPTGFRIVPIGRKAMTPLVHALTIQALGPALRERPIVVLLSPFNPQLSERRQDWFASNFSRLHASVALTSGAIPRSLRLETAGQLLQYPYALSSDPVLRLAAHIASIDSRASVVPNAVIRPIAWLDRLWLTAVDGVSAALNLILHREQHGENRVSVPINWTELERMEREEYARVSRSNPFGLRDSWWIEAGPATLKRSVPVSDSEFKKRLNGWPVFGELATLAHSAHAVAARVLVIGIPYSGAFMDSIGISKTARTAYYDRLQSEAQRLGILVLDGREYDMDRSVLIDAASHLSSVGWLIVNRSIDEYVHSITR